MFEKIKETAKKLDKTAKEKAIIKEIDDLTDNDKDVAIHLNNYLNIAYYSNRQWLAQDKNNNRIYEPPKEPHKVRITANKIKPIVRAELGKITKNKPIMNVIPASPEDADVDSAKVGDKVMDYLEYELGLQNLDRETVLWGLTTSIVFVKPFWNINKGDFIDANTKMGDCDVDIVSRFEVKYDRTAKTWREVKWIEQSKDRDVDYVKAVYGVDVKPDPDTESASRYEVQIKTLNTSSFGTTAKTPKNSVKVREFWEKPSYKYPKGRRVTRTSDTLLFYSEDIGFGEEDDSERELPFFPFIHIKIPGIVEGQCVVDDLREIQKEYNISRSQLINHKNLMGNPQWLVEENSLVDDITDESGGVITYKKGFTKPEQNQVTPISSDIERNIEMLTDEFYFISGQNDVSQGNTQQTNVKSGIAIRYLEEQDDTKLGPTIQNWIDCKREYMRYLLKMVKFMYKEPRMLKIVGKENKVELIEFMGSDLTSTDVRVQEGSMFKQSRSAKEDFIFQLIGAGLLTIEDKPLIFKMLEMGVTDDMYDQFSVDVNQAHGEEIRWALGDTNTLTREFFNHQIHIEEHNKFRKSEEYTKLDPSIQQMVDSHVDEHINYSQGVPPDMAKNLRPEQLEQLKTMSPEEQQMIMSQMGGV